MSSATRLMGRLAKPGKIEQRYSRIGILSRRQVSTTETIAATRGPACSLPMCIQLWRPNAIGRMAFSARLLLNSNWEYSRKRLSRVQSVKV